MIVDFLAGAVPDVDAFTLSEAVTNGRLRGYAEHFGGTLKPARTHAEVTERWAAAREAARDRAPSEEDFLRMLDDGGIGLAGVYTESFGSRLGVPTADNQLVADFVKRNPERTVGFAGIDPWEIDAAHHVEEAVHMGLSGVVMSPFKQQLLPGDPRMARVYGRCEALGVPVLLHTGINWSLDAAYDVGHPRHIDAVASAFPDLKLVALHAGWPWVEDMMMVTWRHENVYVDLSAHRPRTFTKPDSGWAPLLRFGNRQLADRVLFASTWTLLGVAPAELAAEVRELPLKDEVAEKWLGGNALRLLGRE
ncbi:amidohydrolase [Amycolatopsis sp. K13G38]|uniref:Amidohydrolase n=1 Tax=Amycolatopsis acididurans TaxID=2724524 RepID=A0ABX1J0K0_9PSEU|nr:amidohydrolase family protein [Amycolatopsis acididurans]NKQ53194.1 amidohydrolase [Amycolatopsis acididurans]